MTLRTRIADALDNLELAFWPAFLVLVALVVGAARSLAGKGRVSGHEKLRLVTEDDPDGIDPLGDLTGILS